MKPKSRIVHLPVYQPGKPIEEVKRELGLDKVIKLASNENPFGCSPKAREAILAELDSTHIYPDGGAVALTAALSERLGVQPNQIIFGAGSDEVILMLTRAYLLPGDETVMATHTFPQYKHNAEIEGATVIEVPLKDGKHDLEAMLAACTEKTKIVWICNPNNPTGTIVTHAEVEQFMRGCSPETMVVLDEAYVEYIATPDFPDGLSLLKQYPNLVLLRTFSKIYGLASLRIGYGVGHPDVIHAVNQVREPFNTTRYGQAAALASLGDDSFVKECRERNLEGIQLIQGRLDELGLDYFPAYGNFIMIHTGRPALAVFEALLRHGIIVRGGHSLGYPESIRVTVGSREENEAFLIALEDVLKTVSA
ncbi:histidinol-phosphate transaminase [Xylanibacillus composti]|uniref:Histidinol-phosphate aminotransferase n=1 Tax=Xylanibacillus composti TaxID=1572762 RepID=A0A8J4M182_9BACL|nr:histidinol-phosphate transaminase [Xylanibacillus composti]MDT9725474.1 histidinol-phosphate transaminase [Xylanibacillus composti]GIQ67567.1 histidinol-phosphate aminotransferase [Xylanibacillus composti]